MALEYKWIFSQAEVLAESQGLQHVVEVVHWVLEARDEDGVTASCYGSVGLLPPDPNNFVPFNNLEKPQVEAWVEAQINTQKRPRDTSELSVLDQMKENLAREITEKKAPKVESMGFNF